MSSSFGFPSTKLVTNPDNNVHCDNGTNPSTYAGADSGGSSFSFCGPNQNNADNPVHPPDQVAPVSQLTIQRYLGRFFPDSASLLAGMAKAGLILSGSRALEVFFPGSCELGSDLDFYTDPSARCVGEAIRVLEAAGVVFDPPYQPALDIANMITFPPMVDYRYTDKEQLRRIIALPQCPHVAVDVLEQLLTHLDDGDEFGTLCVLDSGVRVHLVKTEGSSDYGHTPSMQIITGHTTFGGTEIKTQLIFAAGKSALSNIFSFYATCVQVAITGVGAAHFYSGLGRRALYWSNNTQHQKSAQAAMLKYARRGYTFESSLGHAMRVQQLHSSSASTLFKRTPDSTLVLFKRLPLSISPELYAARQAFFKSITWMEHNGETMLLSQPTKAMRDVMADERRKRVVLRANGIRDDSNVHIACLHSVFFKAPTNNHEHGPNHRYPDEIIGF